LGLSVFSTSAEGFLIVKCFDNKGGTVASNYYTAEPVEVRRWDKKKKRYIVIPCPALISVYSKGMGVVDIR
jgi:hypothetical protein